MSEELLKFDMDALPDPDISAPAPEFVLTGNPMFRTWVLDKDPAGTVTSGVWEASPGSWISHKNGAWEFATILSGEAELAESGKAPLVLRAGSTFVMRPDFKGYWKVTNTLRKLWVIRST